MLAVMKKHPCGQGTKILKFLQRESQDRLPRWPNNPQLDQTAKDLNQLLNRAAM
jgi:hypothetical protein